MEQHTDQSRYEPSIDGLRAVAVMLVLLFHFDVGGASHGYLGVDVFFVISGYLVGGMIFHLLDLNQFCWITFVRRRISRLLPMLAVVSPLVLIVGFYLLLPGDYVQTSEAVRAAVLIHANHYFHQSLSYFGPGKYDMHMLHSWSLSVEEQFYILFPVGAILLARSKLPRSWAMAAITVVALIIAEIGRASSEPAAFYWMAGRAWQLLAGAWLATTGIGQAQRALVWQAVAMLCLAVIFAAAWLPSGMLQDDDQLIRVAMTLATVMLIACNRAATGNFAANALSLGPICVLGKSSYAVYLVHWPLLTMVMAWNIIPLDAMSRAGVMAASIAAGMLAWRYIETPLRRVGNSARVPAAHVFLVAAMAAGALWLATSLIISSKGYPDRLSPASMGYLAAASDTSPLRKRCHSREITTPIAVEQSCQIGAGRAPHVALWADSHGAELSMAVGLELRERGDSLLQMTSSSCPPLVGLPLTDRPGCKARNDRVIAYLTARPEVSTVILAMFYDGYAELSVPQATAALVGSAQLLNAAGKRVIIVGPFPRHTVDVPRTLARQELWQRKVETVDLSRAHHDRRTSPILTYLNAHADGTSIMLFDPGQLLCNDHDCPMVITDGLSHFDDDHISMTAATKLAVALMPSIPRAAIKKHRPRGGLSD